ncbi:MAG: hypothetical protein ACLFUB_11060 [Cyclobacteriaceae bacterium]
MKRLLILFFICTCLLSPTPIFAQKVISYIDSGIYPVRYHRLLGDSIYTNYPKPHYGDKVDYNASRDYDMEAVLTINRTIKKALGEDRYAQIDSKKDSPQILALVLYVDSTETIQEVELNIKHTSLNEQEVSKIALALKGKKFKVPPFYHSFSYLPLKLSMRLLNEKYLD